MTRLHTLAAALAVAALPLSVLANPYGLSDAEVAEIERRDAAWEKRERTKTRWIKSRPKFRLVKTVEPDLNVTFKDAVPVEVAFTPAFGRLVARPDTPPAIATLHDDKTGVPYSSCQAPCTLSLPPKREGVLVVYRYGSLPAEYALDTFTKVKSRYNTVDHALKVQACGRKSDARIASGETLPPMTCVKPVPQMAPRAERSGRCEADIRVATDGTPSPSAVRCTEEAFCKTVVGAVGAYVLAPAVKNGAAIEASLTEVFDFELKNERGKRLEAKDGMEACPL